MIEIAHIEYLEKDFLDALGNKIDSSSLRIADCKNSRFLRINGVSELSEQKNEQMTYSRLLMEDIFSGLYESKVPLILAVFGEYDRVEFIVGTFEIGELSSEENLEILKTSFESAFPGLDQQELDPEYLNDRIRPLHLCGLLTGTPTRKSGKEKTEVEQIERLIRGLYKQHWGYVIVADPLGNPGINTLFNSIMNEMRQVTNASMRSGKESPLENKYNELQEIYLKKLMQGKAQGMWNAAIFLYAEDHSTLNHVKAVARSSFGGEESLPERIRTFSFDGSIKKPGLILEPTPPAPGYLQYPFLFTNTLNSKELSCFFYLPCVEMPGFHIEPNDRFKVARDNNPENSIALGEVIGQGQAMGIDYCIPIDHLKKHGLVVGATGSGKTNTLFYLLKNLWEQKRIPFLVIEPAKTEYRKLMYAKTFGKDIQIFTLGNNNISPFRINPFEILPGVAVQTHIDLLKAVFNASFFMWGVLPQVLELCLHDVYTDKGWNLASNINSRGKHQNAFPTLSDLYNKIDPVVQKLGYGNDTSMELRSALKTRINSLRVGGKGWMLDTRNAIPFEVWMQKPTVLELESIGDDEEKAFLMGLILMMMYEHYVSLGISGDMELSHVTIIEEAHRLLANAQSDNPYSANIKAKAIESFNNILSEIRAYGEGFLIAEQIPTKLAGDVVKNTNLKIAHRMVAEDDRKTIGASMNLAEKETRKIVTFGAGEAAVFSQGDTSAYHIRVPFAKIIPKIQPTKQEEENLIFERANQQRKAAAYDLSPYSSCRKFCHAICKFRDAGNKIASTSELCTLIPQLFLSFLDNGKIVDTLLNQMVETGLEAYRNQGNRNDINLCAIVHLSERYFDFLGSKYQWSYTETELLKEKFIHLLTLSIAQLDEGRSPAAESENKKVILDFKELYYQMTTDRQPHSICKSICSNNTCRYRFQVAEIENDQQYYNQFVQICDEGGDDMSKKLNKLCTEAASGVILPEGDPKTTRSISLCFALQKSYAIPGVRRNNVQAFIKELLEMEV